MDERHGKQTDAGPISRRGLLRAGAGLAAAGSIGLSGTGAGAAEAELQERAVVKGRIKQSVCKWCYPDLSLEELCAAASRMGLKSVELLRPGDFATVKKHGLVCAMVSTHGITEGLNRPEHWDRCLGRIREGIEAAAEAGFPNVICFSGNREGMDDETGLKNCAEALKQVVGQAERRGVTICMELLNSRVNHLDYMCDRTPWGVELVKRIGSDRFKLLYDIYHMQIMEGDLIRTIRDNHRYIGHYHTAGNPGRHEMDESQEMYYPAIVRAIIETGYEGYLGQEFIPTKDPLTSLAEMAKLCDV